MMQGLPLVEKIKEDYHECTFLGNGGHAIGFYAQPKEHVPLEFRFERGVYTRMQPPVKDPEGVYYLWAYDPLD